MVCLIYMDASSPAHMRYSVRRLRRKLPQATIMLCCWMKDADPVAVENLREGAKADLAAGTPGEVINLCIEATRLDVQEGTDVTQRRSFAPHRGASIERV